LMLGRRLRSPMDSEDEKRLDALKTLHRTRTVDDGESFRQPASAYTASG